MKKSRLLSLLLVGLLVVIGVVATACGDKNPTKENPPTLVTGNEVGVYYFDAGNEEYLLSLTDEGKVSLVMGDITATGKYTREGNNITLKYESGGIDDMTVTIDGAESTITLTYNGKAMAFLRRVTYRVTFDTSLGSAVEPVDVLNGKTLGEPAAPTREGYVFVGWYKDTGFKIPFAFGTEKIGANLTLYAQWIERKTGEQVFTVKFNAGDYAGAPKYDPEKTAAGKLYNLELKTPTREGYEFKGWWYSVSGKADELTYKVNADTVYYENTTLYAVWQGARQGDKLQSPVVDVVDGRISWEQVAGAVEYKVVVTDAEGKTVIERSVTSISTGMALDDPGSYTVTVTAVSGTSESNNSEPTTRRYNYMTLSRVSLFEIVNDRVLTFNEIANATSYKLRIDCGDESHSHNPGNFIFELYNNGANTTYDFGTCPMKKGGIVFTVIAEGEGYASSESEPFPYDRLLAAIAQGSLKYDSATETISWDAVENATGYEVKVGDNAAVTVGGTSFDIRNYASGSVKIAVSPIAHGYNSPEATEITVNKATLAAPTAVEMNGSVVTWNAVSGAEKYVVEIGGKSFDVTGATRLDLSGVSIDWNKNTDYTVTVKAQSGANSSLASVPAKVYYQRMGALDYAAGKVSWGYVYGATGYEVRVNGGEAKRVEGVNSAEVVLTKAGNNDVEVRYVKDAEFSSWEKVTVFAYELAYDLNGAAGIMNAQYYAKGDPVRLYESEDVTKELTGHSFNGWYTTGAENGQRYDYDVYNVSENTVLYANWKPRKYTLTLNYNNGGSGITEFEVVYGRPFTLPTPTEVFEGTTQFGGWCANTLGTAASYTDETGKSLLNWSIAANTEVYAKWLSVYKFEKSAGGSAGYYYTLTAGDVSKPVTTATIPATYKAPGDTVAYPVTQIGTKAFDSCEGVEVINIPATIDSILPRAFETYTALREINVYQVEGVTNDTYWSQDGVLMYNNATAGTVDLWAMPRAKTGKYTISNRVTNLPTRILYRSKLEELEIPASVTYVAYEAFYYTEIPVIKFLSPAEGEESQILRLELGAFSSASYTTDITLPAREFEIWNSTENKKVENPDFNLHVFAGCSVLTNVHVDENSEVYQSIDGMLCTKGTEATLVYCPNDRSGVMTIPVGITNIGSRAFAGCRNITELVVPNWVKKIDDGAFTGYRAKLPGATYDTFINGCYNLTKVTFAGGDGVAVDLVIGNSAFGSKDAGTTLMCSKLATLVFEKGSNVTVIGEYAFARCPITDIVIPATVSEINEGAFYSCASLITVSYAPDGKDIALGDQVFANCVAFTTVSLPANITEFKDGVFAGCNKLTTIEVDPNNPVLSSVDGVLFDKDQTEILFYPFGKTGNYEIPSTVTKISSGAFSNKDNITNVTIGKNVTYIGDGAFRHCVNLESVVFEEGGTEDLVIGISAFNYCTKLADFRLPERVKEIPDKMLYYAIYLTEIYIPQEVTRIGDYAFYMTAIVHDPQKLVIPASVKEIGFAAFSSSNVNEVEFKDKEAGTEDLVIKVLEKTISYGGGDLWSDAYNPFGASPGESRLFSSCLELTKVTLPKGLTGLPDGMFMTCTKLAEVEIPATIAEMGYTFMNCTNLKKVTFADRSDPENPGKYLPLVMLDGYDSSSTGGGAPTHTYYGVFAGCRNLTTVELPEGLTRIPDYCFMNCTSLESINIPASVQNGDYATGQTQLTAIGKKSFSNGVIGQEGNNNTAPTMKLATVTFTPGGTGDFSLGDHSFANCIYMTSITLPARLADSHVTNGGKDWPVSGVRVGYQIGDSSYSATYPSFAGCSRLTEINVENGGEYYASDDGILYTADMTELVYVPYARSKDVTVPSSVTLVRNFAFYNNRSVKKVTFSERPDTATLADDEEETPVSTGLVIGENAMLSSAGAFASSKVEEVYFPKHLSKITAYAFHGCTALTTVVFAEGTTGFTTIERDTFNTDSALASITLPDCVTTIGDRAFRTNSKLATVNISENSKLASVGSEAFYGTAITEIYLPPAQSFVLGAGAFGSCSRLTTVHIPNTVSSFDNLFTGSYALSTLDIYVVTDEDGNEVEGTLKSDGGVIFVDGGKTLSYYPIGKTDKTYTVPVGVTKIGAGAFMNNGYLEEIYIPNTVELILDKAFYMMPSLKKVVFEKDGVVHYVPLTAAEMSDDADKKFTGDRYRKDGDEYVLDNANGTYKLGSANVLRIGVTVNANTGAVTNSTGSTSTGVFSFCQSLEVVNLPARTEHISGYAFYYCINLHTVTFDSGIRLGIMQKCVFSNTALQYGGTREEIEADPTHPFVLPAAMTEFAAGSTTADENRNPFGKVEKLVIPAGVTKVGNYAFSYSQYLTEVEFTGASTTTLTTVGTNMFKGSSNLTTVIIPNSFATVPTSMFQDCTSLTTFAASKPADGSTGVIIPTGVTKIDGSAFNGCASITKVILPTQKLTAINGSAFLKCTNLAKITYDEENTEYDLYLPTSVTTLAASAFAGTAIETAYISGAVTSFAAIFNYNAKYLDGTKVVCENLKKVVFQSNEDNTKLTSIPSDTFMMLPALEEVVLPTQAKFVTINTGAFAWSGLKRITIPASVTKICRGAFAYCSRLEKIEFEESSTALTLEGGTYNTPTVYTTTTSSYWNNYIYLGVFVHSGDENGRAEAKAEAEKPGATEAVKNAYATNFVIDMSKRKITAINKWSFYDMMNLDVKLSEETATIDTLTFQNAYIDEIEIPAKTTTVKIAAFAKSKIKSIKFAASTTALTLTAGTSTNTDTTLGAFAFCDELTKVDMSGRKITAIPKFAFYSCPKIAEIKWSVATAATETEPMTTHTATIGEAAFQYSFNIAKLDIPRGVTKIENWGFWGDTIGEVKLPNTLTSLGYGAFYEVSTLAKVEFEANSVITTFVDRSEQAWTFGYNPDLKTVVLPDSLITIPANAFYKTGLTTITIPKTVTTIGNYAFGTNPDLKTVIFEKDEDGNCALTTLGNGAFNNTGLTAISIPKSVSSIGNFAFQYSPIATVTFEKGEDGERALTTFGTSAFNQTALVSVSIPASVTSIGAYAFGDNASLTSVTFEKGEDGSCALTIIGNGAFRNTSLAAVVIPASVTSLGYNPFRYCPELTSITIEEGNDSFVVENNVVYNSDKLILLIYASGLEGAFTIPEGVEKIGEFAFAGSKWSGALNVDRSGFIVGSSAFEACGITSVNLGNEVEIGSWAFGDSPELTTVTIGENAEIGESAFENCEKLSSVTVGRKAQIGNQAFADDPALTSFTLPANATVSITAFSGSGVEFGEDMLNDDTALKYGDLDAYADGTIVFNDVATAAAALKNYSELERVELAEGVTTIGNEAFKGITNLKKIIIPSTVTSIGSYAFQNCTSLEEVVFKKDAEGNSQLNEIGMYSFNNTALISVVIPRSVSIFRYYAFYQCPELTGVEFEEGSAITIFHANLSSAIGTTSDARHFAECPKLETVILPEKATFIPVTMFENSGITHVTIPASVTKIYKNAFLNCAQLETVTFAKNDDGSTAILEINEAAFRNSGIKSISVPATVKTFGTNTFKDCADLTTVTFEKKDDGSCALTTFGTYMFEGTSVTSIAIPSSVTAIPVNMFNGVSALKELTFEKKDDGSCALTAIGKLAFAGTGITSVAIPGTVTKIDGESTDGKDPAGAFYNCSDLASITFDTNEKNTTDLNYIYAYAFAGAAITEIILPTSTKSYSIYYNAFSDCPNLRSVRWALDENGNSAAASIYYKAFDNCPMLKNFVIGNNAKPWHDAFNGWGSDMTIYVMTLPGPNSAWNSSRWLTGCGAKWVWYWSEEKGFLNENGEFENAAA